MNIRGQISVMISVMMATFILFFAFVVNTGMLVNAKINLQNAADLAAYAGASVQARQLTHISYLNYEMRRQWKKFLYRIYVLGNYGYDSFPPKGGSSGPMSYIRNATSPPLKGPTTCVYFDVNHCRVGELTAIGIPPPNFMDPITDALRGTLQSIENIRQDNCKQSGMTNLILNAYWLFNTDPNLTALQASANLANADKLASIRLITSRALGLGIVPKEILLKMRILTLQKYVNTPAQIGLTQSKIGQFLSNNAMAPAYERSIAAYNSAYYTLGNFTFNGGSIVMDELLPSQILALKEIRKSFDTFALDFELKNPPTDTTCVASVYKMGIPQSNPITLGFYKDPKFLTYYAIRLKAQAQILFSPFGPLDLQAYAVAQPFGSRIGPNEDQVGFTFPGVDGGEFIPSVSVQLNDPSQPTFSKGWNTREMIGALASGSGVGSQVIDPGRGYQLAMAPNPWETSRYNIMSDAGTDAFINNFDSPGSYNIGSLWAPLTAGAQSLAEITSAITQAIGSPVPSRSGQITAKDPRNFGITATDLIAGLQSYVLKLQGGQAETKEGFTEGFNVVKISNPLYPPPTQGIGSVFTMDPSEIKSSWNQVKDGTYASQGRVGYSVKFVSFSSIATNPTSSDGNAALNGPSTIGDSGLNDQVFPYIKH